METLIFVNRDRVTIGSSTISDLLFVLDDLATATNGIVIDLADYGDIQAAYALWDSQPGNPLAANFVASHIKSLTYSLAQGYPNLQYMVLVGDDNALPHRRIIDEALVANERKYAEIAYTPALSGSLDLRYFLSDDYYAGLLPLPFKGREFICHTWESAVW